MDSEDTEERYVSIESDDTEVSSERYVSMGSEDTEERYVRARSMESPKKGHVRGRSFRDEDYSSRRVFLYSYPLQWGGEDKYDEEYKEKTARSLYGRARSTESVDTEERYVSIESEDTEVSSERYVSMESEDTEEERYVRARSMESSEKRYVRARSFRDEDYSSRRVFLYSYPLQWGGEDKYDEEYKEKTASSGNGGEEKKKSIKELIVSIFRWGEVKVLVLRRFKHKLGLYIIACLPVGVKPPNALVSA
ncbi:hypothetical protein Vadar_032298 [Vaccinium darrowii]|uniref:Uncharacterized protein n=1 Tax=Vaccinium darrowii TaxID=229202 RepID=A0ACB7X683_9ERIC|nr:hypothetical protein Vadar_032298 [Vaccinium darrowii]